LLSALQLWLAGVFNWIIAYHTSRRRSYFTILCVQCYLGYWLWPSGLCSSVSNTGMHCLNCFCDDQTFM